VEVGETPADGTVPLDAEGAHQQGYYYEENQHQAYAPSEAYQYSEQEMETESNVNAFVEQAPVAVQEKKKPRLLKRKQ